MELLNPAFIILLIKITICVVPASVGVYCLSLSEEAKRSLRNSLCNRLFGVSNAISYPSFERALWGIAVLCFLVSLTAAWFLVLSPMLD